MIRYCVQCVMPDTKPDLSFDVHGVCNACQNYARRAEIDWESRRQELLDVLDKYRNKQGHNYDCVVPVSGGKDSTYQVVRMLEFGLNPLCVTATTCDLSPIGRANIENIKHLGVDYVEVSPNKVVRTKLNRIGLTQVGDISWPEHVGIFTIPVRAAVQFGVPLIVWGENPQNEYGGPAAGVESRVLNRAWLEEFGGLLGLRVSDLVGTDGIQERDLIPYLYPDDAELSRVAVTGLFLGYYLPWDGLSNALTSQAYGLTTYTHAVEGSMVNYENLDNHQTGIHDYFKFLKFGFGRATDLASMQVRRGRLNRDTALEIVRRRDGVFPWNYLGKSLDDILAPLELTIDDFKRVCDNFTNKRLFVRNEAGHFVRDRAGNLVKTNYDNQ